MNIPLLIIALLTHDLLTHAMQGEAEEEGDHSLVTTIKHMKESKQTTIGLGSSIMRNSIEEGMRESRGRVDVGDIEDI